MADVNEKMRDALVAYRYVQRKMLEKWSEGDERVKAGLWAALHKCEALADAALAEQPAQDWSTGQVDADGEPLVTITRAEYDRLKQPAQGEAVAVAVAITRREFHEYENSEKIDKDGYLTTEFVWLSQPKSASTVNLYTAPPAQGVPYGWKLVPIRMPDRMVAVMQRAKHDGWDLHGMWESLLAAAPAPAVPDDVTKQAARYRWLRDHYHGFEHFRTATINGSPLTTLDREVDAMLAAAPEVPRG